MASIFWAFGLISIWLFGQRYYVPIPVSTGMMLFVSVYSLDLYRKSKVGPLVLLLLITYLLPFIHVIPYNWFDFRSESPVLLWGLAVNPYMTDQQTIELMAMIGAVGACGFAAGISVVQRGAPLRPPGV